MAGEIMKIEVSPGELVDKVSILAIKLEKMQNPAKLANVRKEYDILRKCMLSADISETSPEYRQLVDINRKLWEIEDKIRRKEAAKQFDGEFVELARSVYFTNDERASVKRKINERCGSELTEEKEYAGYC